MVALSHLWQGKDDAIVMAPDRLAFDEHLEAAIPNLRRAYLARSSSADAAEDLLQ